jgi:hypothetical protein
MNFSLRNKHTRFATTHIRRYLLKTDPTAERSTIHGAMCHVPYLLQPMQLEL